MIEVVLFCMTLAVTWATLMTDSLVLFGVNVNTGHNPLLWCSIRGVFGVNDNTGHRPLLWCSIRDVFGVNGLQFVVPVTLANIN